MNAVEKVIEDLKDRFKSHLGAEVNRFLEVWNGSNAKLRAVYKTLLRKCFDEFASFLQNYTFPEGFIYQFSFPLAESEPENMETLKLLKLIEVNTHALGQIKDISSLHLILYHTPETFKKIVKHHPDIINTGSHVTDIKIQCYPVYPDDREAVELFVKKYIMPPILSGISPHKTSSIREIYNCFLHRAFNLEKEMLKEVFVEVSKNTGKKNLWFCISTLHPLIEKHPELLLTLIRYSPAFRKGKKKSLAGETIPWKVKNTVTEEVFKTLNKLPEKVVEALIREKICKKRLYIPSPLWIPLLSKKCFEKYPELTKEILINIASKHINLLEKAECRIHVPKTALSAMTEKEINHFLLHIYPLYGTKVFFSFKCVPDGERKKFELIYRTKWLIKDMLKKYCSDDCSDGRKTAHNLFVLIDDAYEKHMNDEEVDVLIEIALQYWGVHIVGHRIRILDRNYLLNYIDTSFISPERCEKYFNVLKKLLHNEENKTGKEFHQLQLFINHKSLTEVKKEKKEEKDD